MLHKFFFHTVRVVKSFFIFFDYRLFLSLQKKKRFLVSVRDFHPCLGDKTSNTGFDRHYIYHTAWAARKLKQIYPEFHMDISSSLFFSGIVSSFVPVKFYDYRPADLVLDNFESHHADLLSLPFDDGSIVSLSCMHVIEHVGLGRYGEHIDPDADLKAIQELIRVLRPGGYLLFVVPVGVTAKIHFNAHRVYTLEQINEYFSALTCVECTLIPEKGGAPIVNATESDVASESYACGCFLFKK